MTDQKADTSLKTERSTLRRARKKGSYDRAALYALLDTVPLCHVGYVDGDTPVVTPTLQWREGDRVYWHGARESRPMISAAEKPVCLTVTRLDGLVMARSGFKHSANHVSAMIFGTPTLIEDDQQKTEHLQRMFERLFPGRWQQLRPMTEQELNATAVIGMDINEAAVKTRSGPPDDPDKDLDWPVWAGTIPIHWQTGSPVPDPKNTTALPEALKHYRFGSDE